MKLKKFLNHNYSNYNKSECSIYYPRNKKDILNLIDFAKQKRKKILPIGSGLSWYDTIFNTGNIIIDLSHGNTLDCGKKNYMPWGRTPCPKNATQPGDKSGGGRAKE